MLQTAAAEAYFRDYRLTDAVETSRRALAGAQEAWGPDNRQTLNNAENLARYLTALGEIEEALDHFEKTLMRKSTILGEAHVSTNGTRIRYARALLDANNYSHAEMLFRDAIRFYEVGQPSIYATARIGLAEALLGLHRLDDASEVVEQLDRQELGKIELLLLQNLEGAMLADTTHSEQAESVLTASFN